MHQAPNIVFFATFAKPPRPLRSKGGVSSSAWSSHKKTESRRRVCADCYKLHSVRSLQSSRADRSSRTSAARSAARRALACGPWRPAAPDVRRAASAAATGLRGAGAATRTARLAVRGGRVAVGRFMVVNAVRRRVVRRRRGWSRLARRGSVPTLTNAMSPALRAARRRFAQWRLHPQPHSTRREASCAPASPTCSASNTPSCRAACTSSAWPSWPRPCPTRAAWAF